ncbi:hypoxanthine phosphoribosyltransferase [Fistulifera solaris]|uniref:Hypoxanthine phosphoribosyltransferase n=1 Tax=Fistulifera solaris TaxID=1519565 RepID=A0A1Z5JJC0_FISSO|nr:hypoxanthine phosphoribosyltransferase [Fistulifera solaris]|eukprot:GAX13878.1 hypoxanthine phosphoribosyltransferase [Fistulifera solaris]
MSGRDGTEWRKPVIVGEDVKPFMKEEHIYPPEYEGHFDGVMITCAEIHERIQQLATLIHTDYKGIRPVLVCTLKGASPFYIHLSDALKEIRQGFDMEFVRASSYEGTATSGQVEFVGELKMNSLQGRHILLIEDIVDTGTTLSALIPMLQQQGNPAGVEVCSLLDKRLEVKKYEAKYVGFSIPNKFVIGYGLDYEELYRDLKDIFVISQLGISFDASTLHK